MFKDFQQKKRNRFRKITNVAITKTQKVFLEGFNEEQNIYIWERQKRLLSVAKEINLSREVGILMDIVTWEEWVILGKKNRIEMRDNLEAYLRFKQNRKNTLLFMHNHPNTSTFSGKDFKTFCTNESLYMIIVVGNDGTVHVLYKTKNFDKENALLLYYKLAMGKYANKRNNGMLAMKELLKRCNEIGLVYKRGGRD